MGPATLATLGCDGGAHVLFLETDKLAYTHTIKYAANLNNIETTGSLTLVWDCLCSALRQACFVVRISCHLT